jgi:hypothetical protein
MDLVETGDSAELFFDPSVPGRLTRGEFAGLTPVIIRTTPLADVRGLLGIAR